MEVAFRSSLLALFCVLGFSEVASAAELAPQETLPATAQRLGVAARFEGHRVHFWSCDQSCRPGEPSLSVDVPAKAAEGPRKVQALRSKTGSALWIQLGTPENFYSLIVVSAPRGGESASVSPSLILKGWAGDESDSKTKFQLSKKGAEDGLSVLVAAEPAVCGRKVPLVTRVLDLEQGRFLTVRAPVLSSSEKERAVPLLAEPERVADNLLVGLSANGDRSNTALVDGDRKMPWSEGYEFIELKAPLETSLGELVLEVAEPLQEEQTLYLATAARVYQIALPASNEKTYVVKVPDEKDLCVALVQPRTPVPVSEVMVRASEESSTSALVKQLEKSDPGSAHAALLLRGSNAAQELADRFYSMSPLARGRALELAARLNAATGVPVFIAAIESGNEAQAETGLDGLLASGTEGVKALEERLKVAVAQTEPKLIEALVRVSPSQAARVLPSLLEDAPPGRRELVRDALSKLTSDPAAKAVLRQRLRDLFSTGPQELSPHAQVELVRALGPLLIEEEGAERFVLRLAQDADFSRAYHLAPHVAAMATRDKGLEQELGNWLLGKASAKLSETESAALSVHVLGVLGDTDNEDLKRRYERQVGELLASTNMRVRHAALMNLARVESRVGQERAKHFLVHDDWPEVRSAAAARLAASVEERDDAERLLTRRLTRDRHEGVRRAIAQGLAKTGGEPALVSLRRAFAKDESYPVRAEAALSLGRLCDKESLDGLTHAARKLAAGAVEDGPVELGLAAVTAIAYLRPPDMQTRLAPLLSDKTPGITRQQVERRLEMVRTSKSGPVCRR